MAVNLKLLQRIIKSTTEYSNWYMNHHPKGGGWGGGNELVWVEISLLLCQCDSLRHSPCQQSVSSGSPTACSQYIQQPHSKQRLSVSHFTLHLQRQTVVIRNKQNLQQRAEKKTLKMFSFSNHIKLERDSSGKEWRMEWNRTVEEVGGWGCFLIQWKKK